LLRNVKVVVALGRAAFVFGHNRVFEIGPGQPVLIGSYHPSRQHASTGKLTEAMLEAVSLRARKILARK
jgi:uracil-DNA glycosylase